MEAHQDDDDCNCRHDNCDCDLLAVWLEQNKIYHFEGDRGLERLEQLFDVLGYVRSGFRFGNVIEQFLSDNPGAQEALIEFVREWTDRNTDWQEKLRDSIEESYDDGIEMEDE